jgi:hypothetical protein
VLFGSFAAKKWTVLKLISWRHSFEKLAEENEMAKKKKEALNNLLNTGRISQATYDLFDGEINEAVAEIERQQKALLEKMNSKMGELEEQIKTLEMLLANFEIQHVTGEVDEEFYQREIGVLSLGINTAKQELDTVKEAVNQLTGEAQVSTPEVVVQEKVESHAEEDVVPEPKVEVAEERPPDSPVEPVEIKEVDSFQAQQENPKEATQCTEEEQSAKEAGAKGEEKQET